MTSEDLTKSMYVESEETYRNGEIIFKEGTSGDWIYVVLSGQIEIFKMVGGKKIVVDMLKKGELFGEVSFVDKQPRSASARAVGDVTLGVYDQNNLISELNKLPSHIRAVFDSLARRLRKMTAVATNLAGRKNERASEALEIKFGTQEEFFKAYSSNIGGGGLFIRTSKLLEKGREVALRFNLPGDKEPINTNGKVAWVKKEPEQGMGVQFVGLRIEDLERLNSFLRKKTKS